jgi:hypothetical protein
MPYADGLYFHKTHIINEQFGIDHQFSAKSQLKLKISDFYVQWNI